MEPTELLFFKDVGLTYFSTFGDACEFSAVVEQILVLEFELDENMPRPKSNIIVFETVDAALELKV